MLGAHFREDIYRKSWWLAVAQEMSLSPHELLRRGATSTRNHRASKLPALLLQG